MAVDTVAFAKALGIDRAAVLGWSMGGMHAQVLVSKHPTFVSQAVLVGTLPPGKPRFKEKPVFLETMVKPVYDFEDQVQLFFSQSEAGRQSARSSLARIASRQIDREPAVTEANYTRQRKATVWYYEDKERHLEQLQSTAVPPLVVHGDGDLACAVENWYALDPKPKTMDMVVFHDANHGPHHQYPVRSANIVKDFLARYPVNRNMHSMFNNHRTRLQSDEAKRMRKR